jgi:hypothetical protein
MAVDADSATKTRMELENSERYEHLLDLYSTYNSLSADRASVLGRK